MTYVMRANFKNKNAQKRDQYDNMNFGTDSDDEFMTNDYKVNEHEAHWNGAELDHLNKNLEKLKRICENPNL